MPQLRRLLWYFYKPIMVWTIGFSIICMAWIVIYGLKICLFALLFKLIGYASVVLLRGEAARNGYMFYRNAGYSARQMYTYVFSLDFAALITALVIYIAIAR